MQGKKLLVTMVFVGLTSACLGQTGIIDSSRRPGTSNPQDWGGAGIPGGIPSRATVCATLNSSATASQINSAIQSCPSGQVVYLSAGNYTLSSGIVFGNKSNVTLRGAGADKTFLRFTGAGNCKGLYSSICVDNGEVSYPGGPSRTANWTGGYAKGTTQITLSSTAGLVAGESLISLDQLDDSADTGAVWVCQTTNVCSNGGPSGTGRTNRSQSQLVRVTAINGNIVTISPGLYMPNWRSSQSPGAWWSNTVVKGVGVENLSVDHANSGGQAGIIFFNSHGCWLSGVRSLTANRSHVWLYLSSHAVIRDSYFYATANASSQSYGVEVFMSSDSLIENNIFQKITAPMIFNGSGSGTVFGYNYALNNYYSISPGWMQAGNYLHSSGTDMLLLEGNESTGLNADQVHGTHNLITAFRNRFIGWETGKTAQTIPVHLYTGSRYFNVVGNVLGKRGYHTRYESVSPSGTNGSQAIFTLGWSGNNGGVDGCCKNDPLVASTLFRWGNYDVVTGTIRWNAVEVPSNLSQFANPVPSSQSLPSSFYLSGKPSWFGNTPWPAIGPDVTGGQDGDGYAHFIPARQCYDQTPKSGEVLNFNADICYDKQKATVLQAPTNLTTTVPE